MVSEETSKTEKMETEDQPQDTANYVADYLRKNIKEDRKDAIDTSIPSKHSQNVSNSTSNDQTPTAPKDIEKQRWDDPLTPLDQKFVTFKDMNDHYSKFLGRIQQQMSNVGGGGTNDISDIRMPTKTVTSSSYDITSKDYYIGVNYAGTPVITLPLYQKEGKCFIVKDERGEAENAGRFITIQSAGNELIDGEDKVILMFNNGSLTFVKRQNSWRVV